MKRYVLIGGAWPYANGSLHLGHVAALLPGDIIARYHRALGDEVCFVSGSDCHGTPITVRAQLEGVTPEVVAQRYHAEFVRDLGRLGFSYDLYASTMDGFHQTGVREAFRQLIESGWLVPRTTEQTYCQCCNQFLPDRYVGGTCPACGDTGARGDQCDACGKLLAATDLVAPRCRSCGQPSTQRPTEHLHFRLSAFQDRLRSFLDNSTGWRANARGLTERYLDEGLVDRAATRDIDWGIGVPLTGYEAKRIYVWFEAVSGYLTASREACEARYGPDEWRRFWNRDADNVVSYYVHGKDNIPFHTLIWPALLMALGDLRLPDRIISSEHLTLEGRKLSTSRNWAVWVPDFLSRYAPDALRYLLATNGPETRDADFSWREFVERNNGELLGGYGNFIHRSLTFINKHFDSLVPDSGTLSADDSHLLAQGDALFASTGARIEAGRIKEAIREVFEYVRACNKYFDAQQPWVTVKVQPDRCRATMSTCVGAIGRLCQLLAPFLPFSSASIRETMGLPDSGWCALDLPLGHRIGASRPPFERLDKALVEQELARLGG